MSIREGVAAALALAGLVLGVIIGLAVQRTWTSTHTTAALVGGLLVVGFGLFAVSQAIGVELSTRRPGAGAAPNVTLTHAGGAAPLDPMAAQMALLRLMDQQLRVQHRMDQRGLLPPAGAEDLGQFVAHDWGIQRPPEPPEGVMRRPEGGWGG